MIHPKRIPILLIILTSYLMIVLDTSIVITALPKIKAALGFSDVGLSWIQNAYTLTFGGLLLLGARSGDLLGRRRMFIIGLLVFASASVLIGLAQSMEWMIFSRALQGVGASILAPSTIALLTVNFPEGAERNSAVAYYGAAAGIGSTIGLVLGGILADLVSWRAGFFINLPITIIMVVAAMRYIKETPRQTGSFDMLGALSSTSGMTLLVYSIVHAEETGWRSMGTIVPLMLGLAVLCLFVWIESRTRHPIMPLRLFASAQRNTAYVCRFLLIGAMFGFFFYITQFMQMVLYFSPMKAGLAFLPISLFILVSSLVMSRVASQLNNGYVLAMGFLVNIIGMLCLSFLTPDSDYWTGIAIPMIFLGVGQGLTLIPLTHLGIASVATTEAGAASGVINTAHQMGGSLGFSVLVATYASAAHSNLTGSALQSYKIVSAFRMGVGMLVLAFVLTMIFVVFPIKKSVLEKTFT